jgi:hypothetical protein
MNNNSKVPINPFDQVTTKVITSFSVNVNNLVLNTSATLAVQLYDQSGMLIDMKMLEIRGDDYTNWGNNDEYIVNYVAQKLGFVIVQS